MNRYQLITALLLFGACLTATAEAPLLETALTPPEIPYHRTALYTVTVETDPETRISFPEIKGEPGKIEIEKKEYEKETIAEGRVRHIQTYRLNPIDIGMYALPPLSVICNDGKTTTTLTTPPVAFNARALTPAETEAAGQFSGITAPDAILTPSGHSRLLLPAGAGVLLAIMASILLFRRYRHRAGRQVAPSLPPWETALNRLRELQQRDLPATGKLEIFYVDLSAILRYYIEDRFHIQAPEQTTPEFIEAAAKCSLFSEGQEAFLAEFLSQCDRIKFARLQPGLEDATAHFTQVRLFVKETIPEGTAGNSGEQAA